MNKIEAEFLFKMSLSSTIKRFAVLPAVPKFSIKSFIAITIINLVAYASFS